MKLDIACGQNKLEGYIGIDIANIPGVDIVHDLSSFPWPLDTESVDEIHCSHFIEHTDDLIKFMNEVNRILKVGGVAKFIAPYYNSIRAWQDPTHKRAISEMTFSYFNKAWRDENKLDHYGIDGDFDFKGQYVLYEDWVNKPEQELAFALKHYTNVVQDIHATLTKRGQS